MLQPDRLLGPAPSLQTLVFLQTCAFQFQLSLPTTWPRDPAPDGHAWPAPAPTSLLLLSLSFSSFDPPTSSPAQSLLSPAGLLSLFGSSHGLSFTSVPATSVPQKLLLLVTVHKVLSFARSVPSPIQPLREVRGDGSSLGTWNEGQKKNFESPRHVS